MKCPFCKGEVQIATLPPGEAPSQPDKSTVAVLHTMPPCKKYIAEDALVFLRNVRLATVGPVSDDANWPLPVSQKPS